MKLTIQVVSQVFGCRAYCKHPASHLFGLQYSHASSLELEAWNKTCVLLHSTLRRYLPPDLKCLTFIFSGIKQAQYFFVTPLPEPTTEFLSFLLAFFIMHS